MGPDPCLVAVPAAVPLRHLLAHRKQRLRAPLPLSHAAGGGLDRHGGGSPFHAASPHEPASRSAGRRGSAGAGRLGPTVASARAFGLARGRAEDRRAGARSGYARDLPEPVHRSASPGLAAGLPPSRVPLRAPARVPHRRKSLPVPLRSLAGGGTLRHPGYPRRAFPLAALP